MEQRPHQGPLDSLDKQGGGEAEWEQASRTESERELLGGGDKGRRGQLEAEPMAGRPQEEDEADLNPLPPKASRVFGPAVRTPPHAPSPGGGSEAFWEMESEKSPFLGPRETPEGARHLHHEYPYESSQGERTATCGSSCPQRDVLKLGVSLCCAALFFPFLVWGGFVFLPFDAPLLDSAPLRLVYALRCSVFAVVPVVLGWLVWGAARLRSGRVGPPCREVVEGAELEAEDVHRRFVSDSSSLFLVYFLQLLVLTMYLSQEQLKLVPLLTVVFAFGRLVYWVAAAWGSSVRAFGFGLSFLPSVAMTVANIYFIFSLEAGGALFSLARHEDVETPPRPLSTPVPKQRFWG